MLQPGALAPDIDLPDLNGGRWALREGLEHGPVVLAFFKISCPTCQLTLPFLQRFIDGRDGGPQLIAISQDDAPDTHEFQQRFGVSMPTLLDAPPRYSASNAYGITSVPSIFLVEPDGKIASVMDGFNKDGLEKLGHIFQMTPFRESDRVPSLRPG
jgi:peroxiredoxin